MPAEEIKYGECEGERDAGNKRKQKASRLRQGHGLGIVDRQCFAARGETAAVVDLFRVVGFRVSPLSGYLVILESFSHRCRDGLRCFVPPGLSAMTGKAACKGQGRSASQQRMGPSII